MKKMWLNAIAAAALLALVACGGGGGGSATTGGTGTGGGTGGGNGGGTQPPSVLHYSKITLGVQFATVKILTPTGAQALVNLTGDAMPNCPVLPIAALSNGYVPLACQDNATLKPVYLSLDPTTGNVYKHDDVRDGALPAAYQVTAVNATTGTFTWGSGLYICQRFCQFTETPRDWPTPPPYDDAYSWAPAATADTYFVGKGTENMHSVHTVRVNTGTNGVVSVTEVGVVPNTADSVRAWFVMNTYSN